MGLLPLGWQTVRLFTEYSAGKKKRLFTPAGPFSANQRVELGGIHPAKPTVAATIRAAAADGSHSNQFATRTLDNAPVWSIFGVCLGWIWRR